MEDEKTTELRRKIDRALEDVRVYQDDDRWVGPTNPEATAANRFIGELEAWGNVAAACKELRDHANKQWSRRFAEAVS